MTAVARGIYLSNWFNILTNKLYFITSNVPFAFVQLIGLLGLIFSGMNLH